MKILVTGEKGQLGSELKKISHTNNDFEWVFTDRLSFNIYDLDNINVFFNSFILRSLLATLVLIP